MAEKSLTHYRDLFRSLRGQLLIVSPDPQFCAALQDIFDMLQVITSVVPRETAILRPQPVELILFDITPPVSSALDNFFKLRRHYAGRPVLLISIYSRQELESVTGKIIPGPVLQKPFSMDRLLNELLDAWRLPVSRPPAHAGFNPAHSLFFLEH